MEINIATFSVRNSSGNIDEKATLAKFEKTLGSWNSDNVTVLSDVRKAVSAVFDANPGKRLATNYIVAQVLQTFGAMDEKEFKVNTGRVESILALPPYIKTVGAKGGVERIAEAVTAPSNDVSNSPAPKKASKSGKKQSGKGKSQTAQA